MEEKRNANSLKEVVVNMNRMRTCMCVLRKARFYSMHMPGKRDASKNWNAQNVNRLMGYNRLMGVCIQPKPPIQAG